MVWVGGPMVWGPKSLTIAVREGTTELGLGLWPLVYSNSTIHTFMNSSLLKLNVTGLAGSVLFSDSEIILPLYHEVMGIFITL